MPPMFNLLPMVARSSRWILLILAAGVSVFLPARSHGAEDPLPAGYPADRYAHLWQRNPFTLVTPAVTQTQPSAFDKLVLVSWLHDRGKDVLFITNTETNETIKVSNGSKSNGWKIISVQPNKVTQRFTAVISNGSEQGTVKFRTETPATAQATNPVANPVVNNGMNGLQTQDQNAALARMQQIMNANNNNNANPNPNGAVPVNRTPVTGYQSPGAPMQFNNQGFAQPSVTPLIRRRRTLPTTPSSGSRIEGN